MNATNANRVKMSGLKKICGMLLMLMFIPVSLEPLVALVGKIF